MARRTKDYVPRLCVHTAWAAHLVNIVVNCFEHWLTRCHGCTCEPQLQFLTWCPRVHLSSRLDGAPRTPASASCTLCTWVGVGLRYVRRTGRVVGVIVCSARALRMFPRIIVRMLHRRWWRLVESHTKILIQSSTSKLTFLIANRFTN